jgi:peptidoglycan/xylan/chitin deacetylase (PgdA/CDA1 family)
VGASVYWSGLGYGFEAMTRPKGAIILMYHSIAPEDAAVAIDPPNRMSPQAFEKQMAFLHEHRHVVSMSDLVAQLDAGETPPAGTVCITFDDGYLDNLTTAAPILDKYRLPATLFLPTGYIDRAETQWADVLHCFFSCRTGNALRLPALGVSADLSQPVQWAAARRTIHLHLLQSDYKERGDVLRQVEQQLKPSGTVPRLTMNWDEVRELVRRYPLFEIGGHSRDHIDLKTHHGAFAKEEITGCAQDLQRELGRSPRHFSFPYGRWRDETRAMVQAAGWQSAVGASNDFRIGPANDRFVLARPATPNSMTELRFRTSGAYPGALAMFGLH